MNIRETVERALDGFTIENGRISEFNFAVDLVCVEIGKEIADLEAERDALRADAERYRWLRDAAGTVDWTVSHPSSSWSRITTNYCRMTAGGMDDAIDAAIAAKEPNRD